MEYKRDGFVFTKVSLLNFEGLYVQSGKINEVVDYIKRNDIKYIILNSEYGYKSKSIKFLEKIAEQVIGIDIELEVNDYSPLNSLNNLKYLSITEGRNSQVVDFANLPDLLRCNVTWSEYLRNLDHCKKLEELTFWGYDKTNLCYLKNNNSLRDLTLYECRLLENLEGIDCLHNLTSLYLYKCKSLESIESLKFLSKTLIDLSISKTRKLKDYSPIAYLNNLKELTITDSGVTSDADFLKSLKSLQYGYININISDGKVDEILHLPIMFKNYSHFSSKNIHRLKMNSEGEYVLQKRSD